MPRKRSERPCFRNMSVKQPYVLLVEGINDAIIFHELVKYLQLDHVQIVESKGKDNVSNTLAKIAKNTMDFRQQRVMSVGVVGDADEDEDMARSDICVALHSVGLSSDPDELRLVPGKPNASILILPGNKERGALEPVCLDSVQDDPLMPCVEKFSNCVGKEWREQLKKKEGESDPLVARLDKMRVHAFLATRYDNPEFRLGEAAEADIWPFEHEAFMGIKAFLTQLCGEIK